MGKVRLLAAFGTPLCAFTIILGPGSTLRTVVAVAPPGVVFVMTKSCLRPRLAPSAEGFMLAVMEFVDVAATGEDELSIVDGLLIAIRCPALVIFVMLTLSDREDLVARPAGVDGLAVDEVTGDLFCFWLVK